MKLKLAVTLILVVCAVTGLLAAPQIIAPKKQHPTAFAIVVDKTTYERTDNAVNEYRKAIEKDGLSTYILIDDWKTPDAVKTEIVKLAKQNPTLEGIALVGDIPIAMIRDAQHLTSAFKMDQDNPKRFPFIDSSVPSDRFYDDFDLKFDYIRADSTEKLLHYYSLRADSPQRIEKDIYSARIKPPVADDSKYAAIKKYLLRVAEQRNKIDKLDNALVFAGHGYHSESLAAWESELLNMREQFPQLYQVGGSSKNLYHTMNTELKEILQIELQQPELDLAIFHAHGGEETQYLLGDPPANSIAQHVEAIKLFTRSKLRQMKRWKRSVPETKLHYMEEYGLPLDWLAGAFVDSVMKADSIFAATMDLHVEDINKIAPQAEVVMFDECFNGAFIRSPFIAGSYVFGNGTTIVGIANSVNVAQDIWANEFMGLIGQGVRVGQWHKTRNYLESHLIGDPTFHYANPGDLELNQKLVLEQKNEAAWRELLKSQSPTIRHLAVAMVYKNAGKKFEKELTQIYITETSALVRLQALKCLAGLRSDAFYDILKISISDPSEIVRRFTMSWMGDAGKEEYLPLMAGKLIMDNSKRVSFRGKSAMEKINTVKAAEITGKYIDGMPEITSKAKLKKVLTEGISRTNDWLMNDLLAKIPNDSLKLKKRTSTVRSFRNYRFQEALPQLLEMAKNENYPEELRISLIEALGWFTMSYNRQDIIKTCDAIMKQSTAPEAVKNEALKTKNRLIEGPNNPFTP